MNQFNISPGCLPKAGSTIVCKYTEKRKAFFGWLRLSCSHLRFKRCQLFTRFSKVSLMKSLLKLEVPVRFYITLMKMLFSFAKNFLSTNNVGLGLGGCT